MGDWPESDEFAWKIVVDKNWDLLDVGANAEREGPNVEMDFVAGMNYKFVFKPFCSLTATGMEPPTEAPTDAPTDAPEEDDTLDDTDIQIAASVIKPMFVTIVA